MAAQVEAVFRPGQGESQTLLKRETYKSLHVHVSMPRNWDREKWHGVLAARRTH